MPTADIARGDGDDVLEFVSAYGKITKDSVAGFAGEPLVPRRWQAELVRHIFARTSDGRRRHRIALVGMGRKNGKTALMAAVALYGLLAEGEGAQVFSCAADRDQAKLLFGDAKRMVELSPDLMAECRIFRDVIEARSTGSIYRALSSEAYTKEGLSPTLVLYDELHAAPNRDLFDVMALAQGARVDPLMIIPTTAGVRTDTTGQDSIAYTLWQHGVRVAEGTTEDPTFFMAWWAPDPTLPITDARYWQASNPGLGDILSEADIAASAASVPSRTPESEFRIKRGNEWVNSATTWLPSGALTLKRVDRRLRPKEKVVLFFDGSFNHDCTGIVGCTLDGFIEPLALWERPVDAGSEWEVDYDAVDAKMLDLARVFDVAEIPADPYRWARQIQRWAAAGLPAYEYPTTNPSVMVPACAKFYDAVVGGRPDSEAAPLPLSYGGDPALVAALERHVDNATVKVDRLGPRIVKEHRGSNRSIDLAVCAVGAFDRATFLAGEPVKKRLGAFLV